MANLFVRFMDMGLGDCIVVKLPGGEVLMVDCGSRRDVPDTSQMWNNMRDLVGSRIHALVLTHPDSDHCNHLVRVVPDTVKIDAIYHSGQLVEYLGYGNLVANQRWDLDDSKVFAVTLNATGCQLGTTTPTQKQANTPVALRERDSRGFLKILQSTTNPACNVWILASNVPSQSQGLSERRNAASIVTLIEYGTTKVLLTGDARIETEGFLTTSANATLANLTLAQMPHHGSARKTFSNNFIQRLNPGIAVASAIPENGDYLPDRPLLQRYAQYADALGNNASNILRCWDVARQATTTKRKADGSSTTLTHDIWDIVSLTTTQKLWSTDGHYVEVELDGNGAEVS
jgi:beta-lactamase superfamily II metal-dependent hydrolase